jgi:hypothetical protein
MLHFTRIADGYYKILHKYTIIDMSLDGQVNVKQSAYYKTCSVAYLHV